MMIAIKDWVKQVGLGAGIVAVLSLFPIGYFYGVSSEKAEAGKRYTEGLEQLVKNYGSTQTLLNSIAQSQQLTLSLINAKQSGVREGVNEYNKTPQSSNVGLDDKWVQLYNESINTTESGTGIKVDGKSGTKKETSNR